MFVITSDPNNPDNPEVTDIYGELLSEVARRCDLVRGIMNYRLPLHRQFAVEICFLEFRSICELIALACISAHGDMTEIREKERKLRDTYKADFIIRRLSEINADFYPIPIKRIRGKGALG